MPRLKLQVESIQVVSFEAVRDGAGVQGDSIQCSTDCTDWTVGDCVITAGINSCWCTEMNSCWCTEANSCDCP